MSFFARDKEKKESPLEPTTPPLRLTVSPDPVPTPVVIAPPSQPTLSEQGTLDFSAIYQFAKLESTRFTAEQTLEMLEKIPAAMPLEMKRQTIQVTLTAMGTAIGASQSSIVEDARKKRDTLQHYTQAQGQKTDEFVAKAQSEIAELQRQIAQKESEITGAQEKQSRVSTLCDSESSRLESVLSFFGATTPTFTREPSSLNEVLSEDEDKASDEVPMRIAA